MLNKDLGSWPIGPNGVYGSAKVAIVEGQIVGSLALSPKGIIDAVAKDIGGPVPAEVASFLEASIGLA